MTSTTPTSTTRRVKLSRGRGRQILRIPRNLELPGEEPVMCREGSRLDTLRATSTGSNDLFIEAHALARDAVVVTDVRELSRVRGLRVENWLEAGGGSP